MQVSFEPWKAGKFLKDNNQQCSGSLMVCNYLTVHYLNDGSKQSLTISLFLFVTSSLGKNPLITSKTNCLLETLLTGARFFTCINLAEIYMTI